MWADRRFWDDLWMRRRRADYYSYLSALLLAQDGRRSLRDFFDDDALRFGIEHPRGRTVQRWRQAFEQNGGNLALTWAGVFPPDELSMIEVAQAEGLEALHYAMTHLARLATLMRQLRRDVTANCMASAVAAAVLFGMAWGVPLFTVPRLQHVFDGVPEEMLGGAARALYRAGDVLAFAAPLALLMTLGCVVVAWAGKSKWTGHFRQQVDRWPILRIYRDIQAIQFLSTLTVIMGRTTVTDIRLRDALTSMSRHASPWMCTHLEQMTLRLAAGETGAGLLDTGLFDTELMWFMVDVVAARGLAEGLTQARQRAESSFAVHVLRQAQTLRWVVLGGAVAGALALGGWHLLALDDLRRALVLSAAG